MTLRRLLRPIKRKLFPQKYVPYPEEDFTSFTEYWDTYGKEFPRRADIESTNNCNARCVCCLQHTMAKSKGFMCMDDFRDIAVKLRDHHVQIRGFYTTGEPLMDLFLFQKFDIAKRMGILADFVSLNTNVSLLTEDRWKEALDNTDNITLSFFNVGKEYERMTGGLAWKKSYENAVGFIKYRDRYKPDYRIFIGCNAVEGSNLAAVKAVFSGFKVEYAIDAELRWAGSVITGVVDRAVMYPSFRCDGHLGVLEIKWNGNVELCSYDFKEETLYANILEDSWSDLCRKFFEGWKKPFSLCARCDYWHLYWRVKKNRFRYVEDFKWQMPFLKKGEKPIR